MASTSQLWKKSSAIFRRSQHFRYSCFISVHCFKVLRQINNLFVTEVARMAFVANYLPSILFIAGIIVIVGFSSSKQLLLHSLLFVFICAHLILFFHAIVRAFLIIGEICATGLFFSQSVSCCTVSDSLIIVLDECYC